MKQIHFFIFVFLLTILTKSADNHCDLLHFLPIPKLIKCALVNDKPTEQKMTDPCKIIYLVKSSQNIPHVQEIIKDQQKKTFKCGLSHIIFAQDFSKVNFQGFIYKVNIQIQDSTLKSAFKLNEEAYKLKINKDSAQIESSTYVGFIRGLETFLQSIECQKKLTKNCLMRGLPIQIEDQPAFVHRGLMVDTSRHFLPIHLLYETIDAMMYNKLNIFHWHIVDQDSFPLILDSHPQIAQYSAFSPEQTYTTEEARQLVKYAMVRGVRVVPQLDTPGHAASWGLAPQNKKNACNFGSGYMGPLDVTLSSTYKLVEEVFAQIIDIFPDPIIHLGGDQVVLACLTNQTQFTKAENIKENQIELRYRQKQHQIIKRLSPNKSPMYWQNGQVHVQEGDIIHWWGGGNPDTNNPVVISNYGPFYLDMGVGNYFGASYGSYNTWLDMHSQTNLFSLISGYKNKANVLGGEICLWSEINNQYTHHTKIWIRGSASAERFWSIKNVPTKPDFFSRLTRFEKLLNRRGIGTAPATCQQCQTHNQFC